MPVSPGRNLWKHILEPFGRKSNRNHLMNELFNKNNNDNDYNNQSQKTIPFLFFKLFLDSRQAEV